MKVLGNLFAYVRAYIMYSLFVRSEVYEASRWFNGEQYQTPMVEEKGKHIFVGDIVTYSDEISDCTCLGKVTKY